MFEHDSIYCNRVVASRRTESVSVYLCVECRANGGVSMDFG